MVQFNTRANEILLKLVYYGPGLSGKTTNLRSLHAMCQETSRGEMFSVNTQEDRTLFFDLLPINLGYVYGNAIHLQIYTVPGQVQYDASRRVVLGGADGVVFVADSSEAAMQENVDSLSNLYHNLNANRLNIKQIPFVIQYNKRDLPDAMPVGVMNRRLNFRSVPYFESIANRGNGVLDTFQAIIRETVGTTFKKYHLDKKIKDFDEMLNLIEANIRSTMHDLPATREPAPPPPQPESMVIRHSNVSVADLEPGKVVDAQDLLEDALKSNMETARLYTELKVVKETLERKNEELHQAHVQLEKSNQDNLKTRRYLEGLIQSVGEAIISFSGDGKILTWNAAAEHIFGYPRAEIVGRTLQQLTPASRAGELEQAIAQVSKGLIIRDIQTSRLRKDGTEFPAVITYAPIRGSDDRVLAYSALVRDQGEKIQLERRLLDVENSASLGLILPPIFNELTNRLAPILLHKGLLMEELTDKGQVQRVGKLLQGVDYVQMLLRPLLMVLSPGSPRLEVCNLNTLVQEAAHRVEGEAAAAGVAMEFTLDPNVRPCGLDESMLREGLTGLLRSGLQASSKLAVKRLRIGTRQTGAMLQMVCQDTGPVLPEAEARNVFELSHAKDIESLGTSVIACVARAHGGKVSLRSQQGVGNAFLVELPMVESVPNQNPQVSFQDKRVLVVDDEEFLLECLTDAIGSWGCAAAPCAQGAEAIEKLQQGAYDLIISDIRMPGLSGIQLYQWIQANQPDMTRRILFTTGDSFDPETRGFLEQEKVPHLGKPFDLKKLKQALNDLFVSSHN
jgi:PAS domain S-box-containing protein